METPRDAGVEARDAGVEARDGGLEPRVDGGFEVTSMVEILYPPAASTTSSTVVRIRGRANLGPMDQLFVAGRPTRVAEGEFIADVSLESRVNEVRAEVLSAVGLSHAATRTVIRDFVLPPLVDIAVDDSGRVYGVDGRGVLWRISREETSFLQSGETLCRATAVRALTFERGTQRLHVLCRGRWVTLDLEDSVTTQFSIPDEGPGLPVGIDVDERRGVGFYVDSVDDRIVGFDLTDSSTTVISMYGARGLGLGILDARDLLVLPDGRLLVLAWTPRLTVVEANGDRLPLRLPSAADSMARDATAIVLEEGFVSVITPRGILHLFPDRFTAVSDPPGPGAIDPGQIETTEWSGCPVHADVSPSSQGTLWISDLCRGDMLEVRSADGATEVFVGERMTTASPRRTYLAHPSLVPGALVTGSEAGFVRTQLPTGATSLICPQCGLIRGIATSRDGSDLFYANTARLHRILSVDPWRTKDLASAVVANDISIIDEAQLLVADREGVSLVDVESGRKTVVSSLIPIGIESDPPYAIVTGGNSVAALDLIAGEVETWVELTRTRSVARIAPGHFLVTAGAPSTSLYEIVFDDAATEPREVSGMGVGNGPLLLTTSGMTYDHEAKVVYVSDDQRAAVVAIDTVTGERVIVVR